MADYMDEILPSKMRLDLLYVRNRTFFTDLDVIFWTAVTLIPAMHTREVPNYLLYWGPVSRFISRFLSWFAVDFIVSIVSTLVANLVWQLYTPFDVSLEDTLLFALQLAILFSVLNYVFGLSQVVWDKAEASKAFDLAFMAAVSVLIYVVIDRFILPPESYPTRVVILSGVLASGGFVTVRYRARLITGIASRWLSARRAHSTVGERVLIVGAGEMGEFATWLFTRSKFVGVLSICGIVDDDPRKVGMLYSGYHILGTTEDLPALAQEFDVGIIIYAITRIDPKQQERIIDLAKQTSARLVMLPDMMEIIRNSFHTSMAETLARDDGHPSGPNLNFEEWFTKVDEYLNQQDISAARIALQQMQEQYRRIEINDD